MKKGWNDVNDLLAKRQYTPNSIAYQEKNRKLGISNEDKIQLAEKSSAKIAIQTSTDVNKEKTLERKQKHAMQRQRDN